MTWRCSFGPVGWEETVWRGDHRIYRPLSFLGVRNRGYSLLLQRKIVDFASEESFGHAVERLWEHYHITVPQRAVRKCTLQHAAATVNFPVAALTPGATPRQCVTSMDGTMLPVMGLREDLTQPDGRKRRFVAWREAKHCLAQTVGCAVTRHQVSIGAPDAAGNSWRRVVELAGATPQTYIHGIGDGAVWIADQFRTHFGGYGRYTLDLYHVCERLARVAEAHRLPAGWLNRQKAALLANRWPRVLERLAALNESEIVADEEAPARTTLAYLRPRTQYLDYQTAIKNNLPVGSGSIEGSHRSVLQKRLKISGAWWSETSLNAMAHLRVLRVNGGWESYWKKQFLIPTT